MDNNKNKIRGVLKTGIKTGIAVLALTLVTVSPVHAGVVQNGVTYNNDYYTNNQVIKNSKDFDFILEENSKSEAELLEKIKRQAEIRQSEREAQERAAELRKMSEDNALATLKSNIKEEAEKERAEELATENMRRALNRGSTTVKEDLRLIVEEIKLVSSELTEDQVVMAKELPNYLGKSYKWGADGPSSYDCSGFTKSILAKAGKSTPRTASDQYTLARNKISIDELQFGDLVFFKNTGSRTGITHVGMYIGNGLMVHASSNYNSIKTDYIFGGYFEGKLAGAARY